MLHQGSIAEHIDKGMTQPMIGKFTHTVADGTLRSYQWQRHAVCTCLSYNESVII